MSETNCAFPSSCLQIVLNSPRLCLPPVFGSLTAVSCVLGNIDQPTLWANGSSNNTTAISCPQCCDTQAITGNTICRYASLEYLQKRAAQLKLLRPPGQ